LAPVRIELLHEIGQHLRCNTLAERTLIQTTISELDFNQKPLESIVVLLSDREHCTSAARTKTIVHTGDWPAFPWGCPPGGGLCLTPAEIAHNQPPDTDNERCLQQETQHAGEDAKAEDAGEDAGEQTAQKD